MPALAVAIAARARGGEREKAEHDAGEQPFDLALDFYVNPDHAGIYQAIDRGYFDEAGLDGRPAGAVRPLGADPRGRGRARRPRDLLRAGGAARARPGPSGGRGRGARATAADLADLAARGGGRVAADLAGKTVATPGIPYQTAFLDAILDEAGSRPTTSSRSTSGSTCSRPCSPGAPTRCSAGSSTSRASTSSCAASTRAWSRSTSSGSRPTTSWSWSPTPTGSPTTPSRSASSSRRSSAAPATPSPTPSGDQAVLDAGQGLEPKLTEAEVSDAAAAAAPGAGAVRLHGPEAVGGLLPVPRRPRRDRDEAGDHGRRRQRPAPGEGAELITPPMSSASPAAIGGLGNRAGRLNVSRPRGASGGPAGIARWYCRSMKCPARPR